MKKLNDSINYFVSDEVAYLDYILDIMFGLSIVTLCIIFLCFISVILPTLIKIELSNFNVWDFFYTLPNDVLQEMRGRCEDRLTNIHGSYEEFDDMNINGKTKR